MEFMRSYRATTKRASLYGSADQLPPLPVPAKRDHNRPGPWSSSNVSIAAVPRLTWDVLLWTKKGSGERMHRRE